MEMELAQIAMPRPNQKDGHSVWRLECARAVLRISIGLVIFAYVAGRTLVLIAQPTQVSEDRLNRLIAYLSEPPDVSSQTIFVPPPREHLRPMLQAARALNKKDYARASNLLSELLADEEFEDFLIPDPDDATCAVSMRSIAEELMLNIPWDQLDTYRLRFSTTARQALEQAVAAADFDKIASIGEQYFLTPAGWEACLLMGHEQLQQGRPLAAASCFRKLIRYEPARKAHDPHASLMLATSWLMSGNELRAEKVLDELVSRSKINVQQTTIQFLEQAITLPKPTDDKLKWLTELVGRTRLRSSRSVQQWVLVRGNAQRNATSDVGMPLPLAKWEAPTNLDPEMARVVANCQRQMVLSGASTMPSVHPLAAGNVVVMRTFDQMLGIDFETGKRLWSFPPNFAGSLAARDSTTGKHLRQDINAGPFEQRYWRDSVYGQASSDGQLIFVVPQPGFVGEATHQLVLPGGQSVTNPLSRRTFNELKAIDLSRQGAVKWEVGGKTGLDEPELREAFFLGPPLPISGSLYAVCHQSGVIRLVVLDAANGHMLWSQQLASTEAFESFSELELNRLAGATPSFSEGVLVCPTGVGALVAVDVASHSAIWARQYGSGKAAAFMPRARSSDNLIDGLWRDSTITIDQGIVVYSPVDSQELICLDLLNGERLFGDSSEPSIPREDSLFVGCVDSNNIVLIGNHSVRAIALADGSTSWTTSLQTLGSPSGRGYFSSGRYYLPTTLSRILQIDLVTGKVTRNLSTDRILGNLICHRGYVISQSADHLAVYPQDEISWQIVAAAEQSESFPNDAAALKSQLLMQTGDLTGALKYASVAAKANPNPTHYDLLARTAIQAAQELPEETAKIASEFPEEFLAFHATQFRAALIDGFLAKRDFDRASELLLMELVRWSDTPTRELDTITRTTVGSGIAPSKIRIDRFVAARWNTLLEMLNDTERLVAIEKIQSWYANQSERLAEHQYRAARLIGFESLSNDQLELLASRCEAESQSLFADEIWSFLTKVDESPIRANAKLRLAKLLIRSTLFQPAAQVIADLQSNEGHVLLPNGESIAGQIGELASQLPASNLEHPHTWNRGRASISLSRGWYSHVHKDFGNDLPVYPVSMSLFTDDFPKGTRFVRGAKADTVLALDALGKAIYPFSVRHEARTASSDEIDEWDLTPMAIRIANRRGWMAQGDRIASIDLHKSKGAASAITWNVKTNYKDNLTSLEMNVAQLGWSELSPSNYLAPQSVQSTAKVWPSPHGMFFLENDSLVCLDANSGARIWEQPFNNSGNVCFGDDKQVVIWNPIGRQLLLFDARTFDLVSSRDVVADWGMVWKSSGINILFSALTQTAQTVRLFDPATNQVVWQREYPVNSRANSVDTETIAFCTPNGVLEIVVLNATKTERCISGVAGTNF